jgi:hypothetical protein
MNITFVCPHCSQSLEAEADMAGQTIECPACQQTIEIPNTHPSKPQLTFRDSDRPAPDRPGNPPPGNVPCKYCGAQHATDAVFCVSCGRNLKTGKTLKTRADAGTRKILSPLITLFGSVLLVAIVGIAAYFAWQHLTSPSKQRSTQASGSHSPADEQSSDSVSAAATSAEWSIKLLSRQTAGRSNTGEFTLGFGGVATTHLRYGKEVDRLVKLVIKVEALTGDSQEKIHKELGDSRLRMVNIWTNGRKPEFQFKGNAKAFDSTRVRLSSTTKSKESPAYFLCGVQDVYSITGEGITETAGLLYTGETAEMTCCFGVSGDDDEWSLRWYDLPPIPIIRVPEVK